MIRRLCILFVAIAGLLAPVTAGAAVPAAPRGGEVSLPSLHPGWKDPGGAKLVLRADSAGQVTGYAISTYGRKSWDITGRIGPDRRLRLMRYVSIEEWSEAPDEFRQQALRQLGGTDRPGYIQSPVTLYLSEDGTKLQGTYSRERISYTADRFVGVDRFTERLDMRKIRDLMEILAWTALAMGLVGGLLSMGLDFVLVVGDAKGLLESLTGRDAVTGDKLAAWERALGAIPLLGGAATTGAAVGRMARKAGPMMDLFSDMLRRVRRGERTLDGASDVGRQARRGDDVVDSGGDLLRRINQRCFAAGTPVLLGDGTLRPIEEVAEGDQVLASPGSSDRPDTSSEAVPRPVLAIHDGEATNFVRVTFEVGGENMHVDCTERHPLATPSGYVAAGDLRPAAKLLCVGGRTVPVRSVTVSHGPVRVFNLTVEGDHCYFVTRVGLLVHNVCSRGTQRDFEKLMDDSADFERLPGLKREPGFKGDKSIGVGPLDRMPAGKKAKIVRQAEDLNIKTDGWYRRHFDDPDKARDIMEGLGYSPSEIKRRIRDKDFDLPQRDAKEWVRKEWLRKKKGVTHPDDMRVWTDPVTGKQEFVAFELKTPSGQGGNSVTDFFKHDQVARYHQATRRFENMQEYNGMKVNHDMVVDLRNLSDTPQQAMDQIRSLMSSNSNVRALEGVYKRTRFITNGADGKPVLSNPFNTATGRMIGGS